jgi:hypothetical protein
MAQVSMIQQYEGVYAGLFPQVDIVRDRVKVGVSLPLVYSIYDPWLGGFEAQGEWRVMGMNEKADYPTIIKYLWLNDKSDRFSLKVDQFSAATVGNGMFINAYNPHMLPENAFLSAQANMNTKFISADAYADNVMAPSLVGGSATIRPLAKMGKFIGSVGISGQYVWTEAGAYGAGAEVSVKPIQGKRLEVELSGAYDTWGADAASTSVKMDSTLSFGARKNSNLNASVQVAYLENGFDMARFDTWRPYLSKSEEAQRDTSGAAPELGVKARGGVKLGEQINVSVATTLAGENSMLEASIEMPTFRFMRVVATGATMGSPDQWGQEWMASGTARVRVLPILVLEASATVLPENVAFNMGVEVGYETRRRRSAKLNRSERKAIEAAK